MAVTWHGVAPARERGLKSRQAIIRKSKILSRSREGAWIEIYIVAFDKKAIAVAPARERGLKYVGYAYGD